jgi:RNA polymerase sigma factor (sigma-70 family)
VGVEPIAASAARLGGISLLRLQSDERLAQLAAKGSDDAFEALVRRHRRSLVRASRRILPDDRGEDAVQQALLDAHQALRRKGTPERFEPWLHRIAINAALKVARKDREEPSIEIDEERVDGVAGPEQVRERRERLGRTVGAIAALPPQQRRALVLRELEGRSHAEIARELGLSGGAVRQLIHRARDSVRSGASALVPPALVLRMLAAGGGAPPMGEVAAGGGGGAIAAKVAVAALVTGGFAGGVALEERVSRDGSGGTAEARESGRGPEARTATAAGDDSSGRTFAASDAGRGGEGSERSGPNRGPDGDDRGSSGPGSGRSDDNSGPGSGGSDDHGGGDGDQLVDATEIDDSSGSGSSGSGSSGSVSSGSGSVSSGSGSGSSGSGSGSSGSGSGSSFSGSGVSGGGSVAPEDALSLDSSGSGSSGSVSSGSGSSGSGSGDLDD